MRQFLAAPGFTHAIASIPPGGSAAKVMGAYYPTSGYCSKAAFEKVGIRCIG